MVEELQAVEIQVKKLVKSIARFFGYEIRKIPPPPPAGIIKFSTLRRHP